MELPGYRRSSEAEVICGLLPQPGCFEGLSGIEVGANLSRFAVLELHHGTERRPGLDSAPLATCADASDSDNSFANLLDLRDLDLKLGKTVVKVSNPIGYARVPPIHRRFPSQRHRSRRMRSTPASTSSSIASTSRRLNPSTNRLKGSTFSCDILCSVSRPGLRAAQRRPAFIAEQQRLRQLPRCSLRVNAAASLACVAGSQRKWGPNLPRRGL
jgi:hypothetical protein